MFCKYCGNEIADDSVFCAKCGQRVQHETSTSCEDSFTENKPIRVQIVENNRSYWRDTTNLTWKIPVAARILQIVLAVLGLFFFVYGIVWILIIQNNLYFPPTCLGGGGCPTIAEDFFCIVSVVSDPAMYLQDKVVVPKFRLNMLLFIVLPALTTIVLTLLWIIKTTPKKENKSILPRDFANQIEDYTWNGFTPYKYLRFIKNDKYGILDAVSRTVVIPASFELIEWREKNKSYDGVRDGVRKTYHLKDYSYKK